MLLTTLAFLVVTGLLVAWHARRKPAVVEERRCPRCSAVMRGHEPFCPRCGAPHQSFELVTAPVAAPAAESRGALHAVVRFDRCVGCGTCVDACPEPGALRLVDKVARVDLDRCKAHGLCVAACPVGAIALTSGDAGQRVEVPDLTTDFETSVPGLYVVGELGGRGLIKNAVNEGKLAVEHVARSLAGRDHTDDAGRLDLVIVGSGPAGLSAGLEATRRELRFVVLEQGTLADSIAKYPRRKLLLAEPVRVPVYGDLWVSDATKEELLQVWEAAIDRSRLPVRTHERVTDIARDDGEFRVTTSAGEHRARRVVLAMGRRGTPRRLGVPGEELDHVFYDIAEMEAFRGQRVLVVGGGDSAVESAVGLAHQPDTTVVLAYRGETFGRVKPRNRERLDAVVGAGRVELLLETEVSEIRRGEVILERHGRHELRPVDVVIVRIGGEAPYPFLERVGVRIVTKEIPLPSAETAAAGSGV